MDLRKSPYEAPTRWVKIGEAPPYTPKDVPELRRSLLEGWLGRTDPRYLKAEPVHPTMMLFGTILADAENYYVSADMVEMASAAEATWPDGETIDLGAFDTIASAGFMLAAAPFYVIEVTNQSRTWAEEWHVRGFAWSVVPVDHGYSIAVLPLAAPVGAENVQPIIANEGGELMVHTIVTGRGDPPVDDFPYIVPIMWMLMQQPIVRQRDEHVTRAEVKRCRRVGLPSTLKVVTLRRELIGPVPHGTPGPRDWSHRWMVSGHWANLAVGKGRLQRRRTWIPAYVKGPADKPLVIKDQVRAWVR